MPCKEVNPCGPPPPKPSPCDAPAPAPAPAPGPCGAPKPRQRRTDCRQGEEAPESALERRIREATEPVNTDETATITVFEETGIHANRSETEAWRSKDGRSAADYEFYRDPNPEVCKRRAPKVKYQQQVEVKFLRPPPPPNPPPITVVREGDLPADEPPPVVIIQPGKQGGQKEPVFLRERPPKPPPGLCPKTITIPGKPQPPPPRKVIIERLPDEPCKPGKIQIERWLGYGKQRRQVILENGEKPCPPENPRNLIIEWEAGEVEVEKTYVCLGTEEADPEAYLRQYSDFADASELDTGDCKPDGVLAVDAGQAEVPELYGDLAALKEVDLAANGLSEYQPQL